MRRLKVSDFLIYGFLACVALSMVLPFVHEAAKSFSHPLEVEAGRVGLWPRELTLGGNGKLN